jgi:hypothetical protein
VKFQVAWEAFFAVDALISKGDRRRSCGDYSRFAVQTDLIEILSFRRGRELGRLFVARV